MEMIYIVRKKQVPPPALWNISYLLLSDLEALLLVLISAALQPYTPIPVLCMLQTHKYLSSFSVHTATEWEHNTDIADRSQCPQKFPDFQQRASVPGKADISHWGGFPAAAPGKYRQKSPYCPIWTTRAEPKVKKVFRTYPFVVWSLFFRISIAGAGDKSMKR